MVFPQLMLQTLQGNHTRYMYWQAVSTESLRRHLKLWQTASLPELLRESTTIQKQVQDSHQPAARSTPPPPQPGKGVRQ